MYTHTHVRTHTIYHATSISHNCIRAMRLHFLSVNLCMPFFLCYKYTRIHVHATNTHIHTYTYTHACIVLHGDTRPFIDTHFKMHPRILRFSFSSLIFTIFLPMAFITSRSTSISGRFAKNSTCLLHVSQQVSHLYILMNLSFTINNLHIDVGLSGINVHFCQCRLTLISI